jgi:hypothetical protein
MKYIFFHFSYVSVAWNQAARPGDAWFVRSALRSVLRVHNALLGPRFGVLNPLVVAAPISIAHFASLPRVGSISSSRCSSLATTTPLPPGAGPGVLSAVAAASSDGRRRPPLVVSGGGGSAVFSDFGECSIRVLLGVDV